MIYFLLLPLLFYLSAVIHSNNEFPSIKKSKYIGKKYRPNWQDLDSRPLPGWYDEVKFGIFIHWGVFSVPSFGSEWFWQNWKGSKSKKYEDFMNRGYKPGFTYQEFADDFNAEFFNATQWTEIFEASGAKYVVITSKHHEGFTLWPSKYSFSWNSVDIGPHEDLLDHLSSAIRKSNKLRFGVYHSLYEWFNPLWLNDKNNNFTTNTFVVNKVLPELKELVEIYKPEVIWSDGDWEAADTYWQSKEFLSWLYNESPVKDSVVSNDRWGINIPCKHGDFYTCQDRYNPGILQNHKWENCMTIDKKSWGYRRNAPLDDYMTIEELIRELVITVSCGGNLLMNVGPTKDGIIMPIFEERLKQIGEWLKINGEAIYFTKPYKVQNETLNGDVWYTIDSNKNLYAMVLKWPENDKLLLNSFRTTANTNIFILETKSPISWNQSDDHVEIIMPFKANKGQPAWVLKISNYK